MKYGIMAYGEMYKSVYDSIDEAKKAVRRYFSNEEIEDNEGTIYIVEIRPIILPIVPPCDIEWEEVKDN